MSDPCGAEAQDIVARLVRCIVFTHIRYLRGTVGCREDLEPGRRIGEKGSRAAGRRPVCERPAGREGYQSVAALAGRASERSGRGGQCFVDDALTRTTRHRVYPTDATGIAQRLPCCENVSVLPEFPSDPAEAGRWEVGKPVSSAANRGVPKREVRQYSTVEMLWPERLRPARCRRTKRCWVQNTPTEAPSRLQVRSRC